MDVMAILRALQLALRARSDSHARTMYLISVYSSRWCVRSSHWRQAVPSLGLGSLFPLGSHFLHPSSRRPVGRRHRRQSSSSAATASSPLCSAYRRAVLPLLHTSALSAPASSSSLTIPARLYWAARISGVTPSFEGRSTLQPAASSTSTIASWPFPAAYRR